MVEIPFYHTDWDRCLYTHSKQNKHGCKLVLEVAHHHIVLISQHYNFMPVSHTAPTSVPNVKTIVSIAPMENQLAEFPGGDPMRGAAEHHSPHLHNTWTPSGLQPTSPCSWQPGSGQNEFNALLWDGTAQNIDKGPWPSALHLLPKKGNHWWLYGDYRALNARTIHDWFPIRHTNKYAITFPVAPYSQKLTWWEHITKFLPTLKTFRKLWLPPPPLLAFFYFLLRPSAWGMPPKLFNDSWARSWKT